MKYFILVACLVTYVTAHTCLISPLQREGIRGGDLTKAGSDSCIKINGAPCGGVPRGSAGITFDVRQTYNVVFQKNLDHYYADDPGYFEIKLLQNDKEPVEPLARVDDSPRIYDLQDLTVNITIPDVEEDEYYYALQLKYVTKNPNAPAVFYQCADVGIRRRRR